MADLERLESALVKAHEAGNVDHARILARAIKEGRTQEPSGGMAFVNRGIAETLGAPVDVVNAGLGLVGLDSERPFLGSESIESGMRSAFGEGSVPREGEAADTAKQRVGQAVGQGASMLLPIGAAGRLAKGGQGLAAGTARMAAEPFVRAPVAATATEVVASAGAGAGGYVAEKNAPEGYEGLARGFGEIGGGVTTGLASQAVGAVNSIPRNALIQGFRAAVVPFLRSGAEVRAARRVQGLSADPEGQAAALAVPSEGNLTPAQRTGDSRIMALERAILDTDAALSDEFAERTRESTQALSRALRAPAQGADPQAAQDYVSSSRKYFLGLLDQRIDQALAKARESVSKLAPRRAETENSLIVRREIEAAFDDAKAQEAELWAQVPRDAVVSTDRLKGAFDTISQDTPRAQRNDIPDIARRLLDDEGGFGDRESVAEVHGLYSELRRIARVASSGAAPNRNLARIANELAEAALEDLGARSGRDEVGRTINVARTFSRDMNEAFTQGEVGRILGTRREGGDAIPGELTLSSAIGRGGAQAVVGFDEIRKAVGTADIADDAVADYVRRRFTEFAAPRGEMNSDRARDFLRRNAELLDRLPSVRQAVQQAIAAAGTGAQKAERMSGLSSGLKDPKVSAGAAFERAAPGREFDSVLSARNPTKAAASLRATAAKDPSGEALRGLKASALDFLIRRAKSGFDETGAEVLNGSGILGALKDGRTRAAISKILSPAEMGRLRRIADELVKVEKSRGRLPDVGPPMNDTPNAILSTVARIAAARTGAQAGGGTAGGSLQAAQMLSTRVKNALGRLTNDRAERLLKDAIQDPELMRALLLKPTTQRQAERIERNLMSWFGSLAVDTDQGD